MLKFYALLVDFELILSSEYVFATMGISTIFLISPFLAPPLPKLKINRAKKSLLPCEFRQPVWVVWLSHPPDNTAEQY
jgi:hypothetical protein